MQMQIKLKISFDIMSRLIGFLEESSVLKLKEKYIFWELVRMNLWWNHNIAIYFCTHDCVLLALNDLNYKNTKNIHNN